jgi:uridine kinase
VLLQNGLFTLMQAALAGIVLNMYLLGVRSNAVYRLRTTPILIGLAGDSGAGKSTLAQLLAQALGDQRVTVINGDDYHRWPRGHEKWQVYTHLNPRGNRVHEQLEHAIAMHGGRSIVKGEYDHATGQFTNPREIDPSDYIVFAGLHALSLDAMRGLIDLKVFLDPDEVLRQAWKAQRDQGERGHAAAEVAKQLEQRQPDRLAYILPQRDLADLVLRLRPAVTETNQATGLWLEVQARNGYDLSGVVEALAAVPGVRADLEPFVDGAWQMLRLAGEVPTAQLRAIAQTETVGLSEIAAAPRLAGDVNGLMQLIVLVCLAQRLRWSGQMPPGD